MRSMSRLTAAMVVLAVVVSAQAKPNFSGRWVIVSPTAGAGYEQIVKQDDKSLSSEPARDPGQRVIYQLDGVERRMASTHGSDITIMARAAWDKNTIVIITNMSYVNGMKTQAREVWSLDAQGRLVIDSRESGPTGPGNAVKVTYVKKQ
jgi:hypothetical protein